MRLAMLVGLTALGVLALQAAPDMAAAAPQSAAAQNERQARTPRVRPQVRVTPRYPYRRYHSPYPVPYAVEYPGPNGVRHCSARYVSEARPSGTVIVPRMRCWWSRG